MTGVERARRQSQARRPLVRALRLVASNPLTVIGLTILLLVVLAAVFQQQIAPYNPIKLNLPHALQPPGREHLLGTDNFGRDILSRIIYGARLSLLLTGGVVVCGVLLGSALGISAGYLGGWVDEAIMRVGDLFMAFPPVLLAMLIVTALKPSLFNAGLTLVIIDWAGYARVMRSQTLTVMNQEFVTAARSVGASDVRIMLRHILPNCLGPLIVQMTLNMGTTALSAAALGFLGLGAQAPTPEWGLMISEGRQYFLDAWWYPAFPGFAIALVVLAFNFIGDGLRDILDPRAR